MPTRGFTLLETTLSMALCALILSALVPAALQLQKSAQADAVTAENLEAAATAPQPTLPLPKLFPSLCPSP